MTNRRSIILIISAGLTLAVLFAAWSFQRELHSQPLPVYGAINNFELTDQNGKPFSPKQLLNKVWVADFIFTSCGGVCPTMSKNMASLHRSYKLDGRVHFVSISVNPDTDSPQVLAEYAKRYQADGNIWHFLTGSIEEITKVAVYSFKLGDMKEPVFHSAYFVLVDKRARVRGYYDGTTAEGIKKLFVDIARVLKEKG